jgi:mono/diheme cytochrome c family protein
LANWSLREPRTHLFALTVLAVAGLLIAIVAGAVIALGVYNIGADAPHTRPVYSLIEAVRERSIKVRASRISAPGNLDSPQRIASGAGLYAEMCSGCHLAPGMMPSELSQGLYPQAPELARHYHDDDAEAFWTIKHGVKMTAMPAWGRTHSDELIWDMVAFLRKLPTLSPDTYKTMTEAAPGGHDELMKEGGGMPGMTMPPKAADENPGHDH